MKKSKEVKTVGDHWEQFTAEERAYMITALWVVDRTDEEIPMAMLPFVSLERVNNALAPGWPGVWNILQHKIQHCLGPSKVSNMSFISCCGLQRVHIT